MLIQVLLVGADQKLSLLEVKCDHKASCHKAYHHHVNHHPLPLLLDRNEHIEILLRNNNGAKRANNDVHQNTEIHEPSLL
jgi:hypothetical protein